MQQLRHLLDEGAPKHCVLADAGYGIDYDFRRNLSDMRLLCVVGVTSAVVVWPPDVTPLPPERYKGMGRHPVMPRRTATRQPVSVKELALGLPKNTWQNISWREGTNAHLTGRFAAVRVRCAGGNVGRARLLPEQWLLIESPADQAEPEKYYLSTLPETTALNDLVRTAHMRWRIERDYQDLKQDMGLGHCEGRGWRGFYHHASMSIAAYGFLMAQRLKAGGTSGGKKTSSNAKCLPFPKITSLGAAQRAQHHVPDSITSLRLHLSVALVGELGFCPHCKWISPRLHL